MPLDQIFTALSDPTRRAILNKLAKGESQVADLARPFDISAPAISRHLKVLEQAGLIERRIDAQRRIISLRPEQLKRAADWVNQYREFWEVSLDRLAAFLENTDPDKEDRKR